MTDGEAVHVVERSARELVSAAEEIARLRATTERELASARAALETAHAELPAAEKVAKQKRQAQADAVRGRAELERRLHTLLEAESLARTRRQQAEQKAQGFRAAATFAASGRSEADGASDGERAERERLVESRAGREAAAAESRAAEEFAEEAKIGRLRAELELHVEAEVEVEVAFANDRDEAEQRVAQLRETIETVGFAVHAAQVQIERLTIEAERVAEERSGLEERLHDTNRRSRESIELRIAELKRVESDAQRERLVQEQMLATLIESEDRVAAEIQAAVVVQSEAEAQLAMTQARAADVAARALEVAPPAPPAASGRSIKTTVSPLREKPKAKPESFIRPAPAAPYRAPGAKPSGGKDEELIPGLKSFMGTIFTRKKHETPPPPVVTDEHSLIADRIARDFGLLGIKKQPGDPSEHPG